MLTVWPPWSYKYSCLQNMGFYVLEGSSAPLVTLLKTETLDVPMLEAGYRGWSLSLVDFEGVTLKIASGAGSQCRGSMSCCLAISINNILATFTHA